MLPRSLNPAVINPINIPPADLSPTVMWAEYWTAVAILPALFLGICLLLFFSNVPRPPYFACFCLFGSLGALSLGLCLANSPLSAVLLVFALFVAPVLLITNFFYLRARRERSVYHRAIIWGSLLYPSVISVLLVWAAVEEWAPKPGI